MICDWIGAGKVYQKEAWTPESPMNHYRKMRKGRHFHPETDELIIKFLECIRDKGLDEFHKMARCEMGYASVRNDYESSVG